MYPILLGPYKSIQVHNMSSQFSCKWKPNNCVNICTANELFRKTLCKSHTKRVWFSSDSFQSDKIHFGDDTACVAIQLTADRCKMSEYFKLFCRRLCSVGIVRIWVGFTIRRACFIRKFESQITICTAKLSHRISDMTNGHMKTLP